MNREKMEWDGIKIEVSYRRVRYARVEMKAGGLFLVLPPGNDPKEILEKHRKWIDRKQKLFEECRRNSLDRQISERTEAGFREQALSLVSRFSQELGVTVNRVSFRKTRSKWGSCIPSKGNISLSKRLQYLPDRLVEYVVFHEVAHLLERRHNRKFWELIAGKFTDYREFEKELISYQLKIESIS